jgi:hypothetical protein
MTQKAYELNHDLSRFEEGKIEPYGDGYLEHYFKGWDELNSAFFNAVPIILGGTEGEIMDGLDSNNKHTWIVAAKMPEDIVLVGLKEWLSSTDYPYFLKPHGWPIMSRRMLDVLLSVGNFSHQVIPVTFKSVEDKETNHDYVILQLLEFSDLLDMDKSVYTIERGVADPEMTFVCNVKLKVLREPAGGFPPIFRIKGDSIPLHVSAVARQALEDAGIQGLDFDTYQLETP